MLPNAAAVWRLTDLAAAWMLTYLVHSTLLLVVVWMVTSRKRVSDTVRDILWKSALVGGIATATIQTAVAREPLGGQLRLSPRTSPAATGEMRFSVREDGSGAGPRLFVMQPRGTRWTATLVVFWLTTGGVGLLWLAVGHARTLRVLDTRTPLDDAPIGARLRELITRARIDRSISLTCSPRIASPVALSGSEVCLPRRALLELDPVEQVSMLAHEVAHLVRRDPEWLVAARAIEMVLFFQPLNRLARHRMQEVAEYLCDDWAVARTSRPVTMAKCLAAVAEWVGRAPRVETPSLHPMSAMVESSGSPLVRRVGRILNGRDTPRARTSRLTFAAAAVALAALAGVAPRISVANATMTGRSLTLLRALVDKNGIPVRGVAAGMMARPDSLILFETGGARISVNSLVRQGSGPVAGPRMRRPNVLYQRVMVEGMARDSIVVGSVVERRAPTDSGVTGARLIPLTVVERPGLRPEIPRSDR